MERSTAFVLFVLLFILGGDEPDANDGTGKVVAYWTNHDGKEMTQRREGKVGSSCFCSPPGWRSCE